MRKTLFVLLVAAAIAPLALGMPYNPGPAGTADYSANILKRVAEPHGNGLNEPHLGGKLAAGDTVRGIVLLIDFPDMPADTAHRGVYFQQMLFDGPWPYGTMTEYYHEVSYNLFTVTGTVDTIWYHAANPHDYYGYSNGMARAAALVREAVLAANATVDFSQYDNNGDGQVDGLFVIHAGPGREEGTAGDTNIHSHKWYLSSAGVGSVSADGVTVDLYSIEPAQHFYTQFSVGHNKIISKGVFCHEFGHVIGLPDLYDTDYSSQGIGDYCLMAGGSWGGNGQTPFRPVHPSAWIKQRVTSMKRAWITPTAVAANLYGQLLPPVETSPSLYKFWKNGSYGQQYFLVENRRRIGHDQYLPTDGLLIWHIDESRSNNSTESRKLVDLECATGLVYGGGTKDHLDTTLASYDAGDYWPGATGKAAFDPFSDPNSKDYSNALTMCAAYNIAQATGDTMQLDIFIGGSNLTLSQARLNDAAGDDDSIPDPGESVGLSFTLTNTAGWVNATGISATLRTSDTSVAITDSVATFANITAGSSAGCSSDSFVFYVKPGAFPHHVKLVVTKTCGQGTYDRCDTVEVTIGTPRVLLVDDDNGASYQQYYQTALDTNNITYRTWIVSTQGSPVLDTLNAYPIVVWFTGNDSSATMLTDGDTTNLKAYLAGGGKLFISSKQLGKLFGTTGFYQDVLKAQFISNNAGQNALRGVPGDAIGGAISDTLMMVGGGPGNYTSSDVIAAQAGADSCFVYRNGAGVGAIKYQGAYKLVYFAFPFESIGGSPVRRSRTQIMYRVMNWLGGVMPATGVAAGTVADAPARPSLSLGRSAPNPFGARTTISYQLAAPAQLRLALYNVMGQQVAVLVSGTQRAGCHTVTWDGRDRDGHLMPNGMYFIRLEAAGQGAAVQKTVLLR